MESWRKFKNSYGNYQINQWAWFYFFVYLVIILKFLTIKDLTSGIFFTTYSVAVAFYILSRFLIAYFYVPQLTRAKQNFLTVTFGIPSKNEEEHIYKTLMKIAKSDYPKNKFDIIAINDGSTDKTYKEMLRAKRDARQNGVSIKIINWKTNRGKREGMAECARRSKNEILIFIDSDSFVLPSTAKELVKYFSDKKVGGVAGLAHVANKETNILTRMQAVRYFVAFKAYKATESIFGSVTCCSGCCAAYRRKYVLEVLDKWVNQSFMGVKCTYGDDRSLTNFLLNKNYKVLYSEKAIVHTFVPDNYRSFMKQQMRWKKSWFRESLLASTFIWRRNPVMSLSFYLGFILPILAPVVLLRAVVWYPIVHHEIPYFYIFGFLIMSALYGIYYTIYTRDRNWHYGVLFSLFYVSILIWQLPYAILTIRDSRWGTR